MADFGCGAVDLTHGGLSQVRFWRSEIGPGILLSTVPDPSLLPVGLARHRSLWEPCPMLRLVVSFFARGHWLRYAFRGGHTRSGRAAFSVEGPRASCNGSQVMPSETRTIVFDNADIREALGC